MLKLIAVVGWLLIVLSYLGSGNETIVTDHSSQDSVVAMGEKSETTSATMDLSTYNLNSSDTQILLELYIILAHSFER